MDLSSIGQKTFATIASVWAAPLISQARNIKKIGILFDGTTIDSRNWKATFEYLMELSTQKRLCIFLLVLTGRAGNI